MKKEGNTMPGRLHQVLDVSYSTTCSTVPLYRLGKSNTVYFEWSADKKDFEAGLGYSESTLLFQPYDPEEPIILSY